MINFYQGKKVFIAGGAGLLGQALIRKLVPLGAKITATEFKNRKIDAECRSQIAVEPFDLRKPDGLIGSRANVYDGQEIVFWAAAKVGGARAIRENPSELIHYNLELTARNIKAAVDAGVERLGFTSSSYVYPDLPYRAEEDDVWKGDVPLIHYGLGWIKRYLETLCKHHHMTSKTKFAIIRPTAYYGPHDDFDLETCHALPALLRKVVEKRFPLEVWGDGSEVRQWTLVEDVAEGLLEVVANYAVADPVNICHAQTNSIAQLVQELLNIEGHYGPFNDENQFPPRVIYMTDKPTVISRRVSDPSKAKRLLGFECKTSLTEGLSKTIEWFKANHQ